MAEVVGAAGAERQCAPASLIWRFCAAAQLLSLLRLRALVRVHGST
jgi:hypothetical protein